MIGEGLTIAFAQGRRTARVNSTCPHSVHEITHIQFSTNASRCIKLSARAQRLSSLFDYLGGERYVAGNDEIARFDAFDDFIVCDIETRTDLKHFDQRRLRQAERLVGNQDQFDRRSLSRTKQDVPDDDGTGIGVYPDFHWQILLRMNRPFAYRASPVKVKQLIETSGPYAVPPGVSPPLPTTPNAIAQESGTGQSMKNMNPLERATAQATKIYRLRYPEASAAFLAGSFTRNEATESSDLDLVILFDHVKTAHRESWRFENWPVEAFIHDLETLRYFLTDYEKKDAVPSLACMVHEGIELTPGTECARAAKDLAQTLLSQGPEAWTADDIRSSRYSLTDAIEDLRDPRSEAEMMGTATVLYQLVANHYLRRHGHWSARGKSISRQLHRVAPEFAVPFESAFRKLLIHAESQDVTQLVEQLLEPDGGFLFDGYRVEAPEHWRTP